MFIYIFFIIPVSGFSQMWVSSKAPDPANKMPHPSSALQVYSESSNTGVLLPRYENQNITNVSTPIQGMILFNTDKKCFMVYNQGSGTWDEIGKIDAVANPSGISVEGAMQYSTSENTIWWYDGTEWKEFDTTP